MGKSIDEPVIIEALNLTVRTIEARARRYRKLVIAIISLALLSVLLSLLTHQWIYLSALVSAAPMIGGFFIADNRTVRHWLAEILNLCRVHHLDLELFLKAAAGIPLPLTRTLRDMLALVKMHQTRVQLDLAVAQQKKAERKTILVTAMITLGLVSLTGSIVFHSILLLLVGFG